MGTNITGIGNANAIGFKSRVTGGIYFPPELKDALVGVWSAYGKSNDSTDRNIIKNKIKDRGGDFVISNAAFKLNSGFGGFVEDFTSWDRIDSSTAEISNDGSKIKCINTTLNVQYLFNYINRDISSFKVKISNFTKGDITYYYRKEDGIEAFFKITPLSVVNSDKVIELPKSYNTVENGTGSRGGFYSSNINIGVTIEQIPSFEGAFVTDGVNDLITSTKTVQEMLGRSNKCTVLSMMCQIGDTIEPFNRNNWLLTPTSYLESRVEKEKTGKTGIYGYTSTDISNGQISNINTILGDKDDYTVYSKIESTGLDYFSVEGFTNKGIWYTSSVAWYWTIIANKVLTTDQINQVIAYYNLDRCVEPTVWYDVQKQGLSNDTPYSDWYLKDFSKNGFDMSLFNFAKKGGSGVAAKQGESTKDWSKIKDEGRQELTIYNEFKYKVKSNEKNNYWSLQYINYSSTSYPITIIADKDCFWSNSINLYDEEGNKQSQKKEIAISANTPTQVLCCGFDEFPDVPEGYHPTTAVTYAFLKEAGELTIEIIPSCKGALCLDGVNDFGKVTGMPIYKDYTVVADYERLKIGYIEDKGTPAILSKSYTAEQGAFLMNLIGSTGEHMNAYTFGNANSAIFNDLSKKIYYQSKYKMQGFDMTIGSGVDGDSLWLGVVRDNDSRFFNGAIYSLMSFPYSMSEFLIERQLKKHKLGTLYPDMMEFRPVIKTNVDYTLIQFYINNYTKRIYPGDYIPINAPIKVNFYLKNNVNELISFKVNGNDSIFKRSTVVDNAYNIRTLPITKSPQKIDITIDEYIRYEDIVQPYPVLLRFKDENGNEVSWGGKFKVGSTITRIGSAADSNLLPNIYNIFGLLLNDNQVTSSKVIVEKTMVFKAKSAYIFDNNKPKCILSPRLLRIPNSSYKILGHIPDISGHGNHGKINNSAYKLNSGVNGYLVDFTTLKDDGIKGIVRTDSKIYLDKSFNYNKGFWLGRTNNPSPAYKVKVSGIPETGMLTYTGGVWLNLVNGINELPARTNTEEEHGFVIQSPNLDWSNLVIEQIGEYEGAYCLDGVDDFVTIPTLSSGDKQVLMKVNWDKTIADAILYDQRGHPNEFAIYNADVDNNNNPVFAYQARNNGQTYIDGILNKSIKASELRAITHNITITNELSTGTNTSSPVIGSNRVHNAYFTNMALYDFMLFDKISTDDKILELNEYVGIEGNTE